MKKCLALLLLGALLLTGCTLPAIPSRPAPAAEPASTPAPVEEPAPLPETPEEPVDPRPGEVRVITAAPATLDPAAVGHGEGNCLLEVYEPLFERTAGGEYRGILAESWEHSRNVYTVTLRSGVTDHDGNALTAADAAFCVKRKAEAEGWDFFTSAAGSEDGVLTVTLKRELTGAGEWERVFGELYLYTEKAFHDRGGLTAEACGTGPYRLASYTPGTELLLVPFENFRQEDTGRGAANVQSIRYLFPEDPAERVIALEVGDADFADCLPYVDTADFRDGGSYADLFRVEGAWSDVNYVLVPNVDYKSMMNKEDLRLGVFHAIDTDLLADFAGEGGARPCLSVCSPDCLDAPEPVDSYENTTLSVDGVRSALRRADYVNEGFRLLCVAGGTEEELACAIQSMLRPLSINAIVTPVSEEELNAKLKDNAAWDLALLSFSSGSAAETWTRLWIDTLQNGSRIGFLKDAKFNALLTQLETEAGRTAENMNALQSYMLEHALAMSLVQLRRSAVVYKRCTEVYLTASGAILPGACSYS